MASIRLTLALKSSTFCARWAAWAASCALGLREFFVICFLAGVVFSDAACAFGGFGGFLFLVGVDLLHQCDALLFGFVLADVQTCGAALDLCLIPNLVADVGLLIQTTIDKKFAVAVRLRGFERGIGSVLARDGGLLHLLRLGEIGNGSGACVQILRRQRIIRDGILRV